MGLWHTQKTWPYNNQQKKKKKKENLQKIVDFAVPADHRKQLKECKKKDKYLDLARELKKKTVEHENDDYANCDWCFWHSNERIIKGSGGFGSWRTSGDRPNDSITEKNPGDLRRLAVTQIPVKNHQLRLMWKTFHNNKCYNYGHNDLWQYLLVLIMQ